MSGVPTPRGTHLTKETKDLPLSELGYYLPLVVKPCENGSSIGVYICHTEEEYNNAVRESFEKNPDEELVIEPYIKGREFASAVIAGKFLFKYGICSICIISYLYIFPPDIYSA